MDSLFKQEEGFTWEQAQDKISKLGQLYSQDRKEFKNDTVFKFKRNKKRFFEEILVILSVGDYLQAIGKTPDKVIFCSNKENLGYDGEFIWQDNKIKVEVTRAADGRNESLTQELLDKEKIAPLNQKIEFTGTQQKNRQFGDNTPQVQIDKHKELVSLLIHAFNKKNAKSQYQNSWLILSVPEYTGEEFSEVCSLFWSQIYQIPRVFGRVFVVAEDFFRSPEYIRFNIDGSQTSRRRTLEECIWDSHNSQHRLAALLTIFTHPRLSFYSTEGQELEKLILQSPYQVLNTNVDILFRCLKYLKEISKDVLRQDEIKFLNLFDHLFKAASQFPVIMENMDDPITKASDHPIGYLTDILLTYLKGWIEKEKPETPIPNSIHSRLTNVIQDTNPAQLMGLIRLIYQSFGWFFKKDRSWTEKHFLPYFNWEHPWSKYLWQAYGKTLDIRIDIDTCLFSALKKDFFKAFEKLDCLKEESYQNICDAFLKLSLESGNHYFTVEDKEKIGQLLSRLPIERFECLALSVLRTLDVAQDKPGVWRDKIGPWILNRWPKGRKNSSITQWLVLAALQAEEAFGEAIDILINRDLLMPIHSCSVIFSSKELISGWDPNIKTLEDYRATFPKQCQELVAALSIRADRTTG